MVTKVIITQDIILDAATNYIMGAGTTCLIAQEGDDDVQLYEPHTKQFFWVHRRNIMQVITPKVTKGPSLQKTFMEGTALLAFLCAVNLFGFWWVFG